jgi:hypothetical protein
VLKRAKPSVQATRYAASCGANAGYGAQQIVLPFGLWIGPDLGKDQGIHMGHELVLELDLSLVDAIELGP